MAWVSEMAKQSVEGVCPQILRPRRVCISWSGVALREVSVGDDLSGLGSRWYVAAYIQL